MRVAYPTDGIHLSKAQRELGAKSGTRKNEDHVLVGRVDKTPSMSLAAYVNHWRGDITVELCECERLLYDWNRSGTVLFIDITLIDLFVALLQQAREEARRLAREIAERKKRKKKPKQKEDDTGNETD